MCICITPNKLTGPHDVSKHFDTTATGFHLNEVTIAELNRLFRTVGFSKVAAYIGARGIYRKFPLLPPLFFDRALSLLPRAPGTAIARSLSVRTVLNVRLIGLN